VAGETGGGVFLNFTILGVFSAVITSSIVLKLWHSGHLPTHFKETAPQFLHLYIIYKLLLIFYLAHIMSKIFLFFSLKIDRLLILTLYEI
jgi:hypothetical protein